MIISIIIINRTECNKISNASKDVTSFLRSCHKLVSVRQQRKLWTLETLWSRSYSEPTPFVVWSQRSKECEISDFIWGDRRIRCWAVDVWWRSSAMAEATRKSRYQTRRRTALFLYEIILSGIHPGRISAHPVSWRVPKLDDLPTSTFCPFVSTLLHPRRYCWLSLSRLVNATISPFPFSYLYGFHRHSHYPFFFNKQKYFELPQNIRSFPYCSLKSSLTVRLVDGNK